MPSGTLPPTGKKVTVRGISICRVAGGKLVEERVEGDWLGLLQQLGAIPMPG
jgi:predicted ester cyclase